MFKRFVLNMFYFLKIQNKPRFSHNCCSQKTIHIPVEILVQQILRASVQRRNIFFVISVVYSNFTDQESDADPTEQN